MNKKKKVLIIAATAVIATAFIAVPIINNVIEEEQNKYIADTDNAFVDFPDYFSETQAATAEPLPTANTETTTTTTAEVTEIFQADFDEYSELIEKYFLGVWKSESGKECIIGKDPENKYVDLLRGRIRYVKKTDNTVELYTYNYIDDEYRVVIDLNEPDTALSYDIHTEASGYVPEKFTRIDTAEMYSDTGKLDDYIDSMLYFWYNYFHGFGQEIESYSNNPLVQGYTVLEEHSADRLVWVEPFEDTASEEHKVVYIRYEEVPDGEYWKVDKWEILDDYDAEWR